MMENEIESLYNLHNLKAFKDEKDKNVETEDGVKIPKKSDMNRLVEMAKLSSLRNRKPKVEEVVEDVNEAQEPKKELGSVLAGLTARVKSKESSSKAEDKETTSSKTTKKSTSKASKTASKKTSTTKKSTTKKATSTKKSTTKTKKLVDDVELDQEQNKTSYKELSNLKLKEYEDMLTKEPLQTKEEIINEALSRLKEETEDTEHEISSDENINEFIDKVVEEISNNKFIQEIVNSEDEVEENEEQLEEDSVAEEILTDNNQEENSDNVTDEHTEESPSTNIEENKENEEMEKNLKTQENELYQIQDYIMPVVEQAKKGQLLIEELDENELVINSKSYDYFYFSQDDMEQREQEIEERKDDVIVEKEMGDINLNSTIANAGNVIVEDEDENVDVIATVNGIQEVERTEEDRNIGVLYVASECQPFIATGGLADVAGSLPKAVSQEGGVDIRVILPLYKSTKEKWIDKLEYMGNFTVHLSWRQEYCGIFRYFDEGVVYYFVDNDRYFGSRDQIYGYFDDGERYAFFSKAVVECLPFINFFPNIIHCNDWQSSLVSTYIKTGNWSDDRYYNIKNIYTIHNVEYQGVYGMENLNDLFGIDEKYRRDMEYNGDINLTKAAIQFCDKFTTVSESYCDNLKQPYCSRGLHYIIIRNEYKLSGIINGIDYDFYNPMTDKVLYKNYDLSTMQDKLENKKAFQAELGLPVDKETPLFSIVSRLVSHKGLDLVTRIMEEALQKDIQLVVVGTGDARFVDYFKYLENKYPTKVRALTDKYSNELARKAYAASDIFIMPSKIEPCGISQMIASRYGTVPIVREVGGLKDSITDFGCENGGNGYTFTHYNAYDLLYLINRAIDDFKDKDGWKKKMETCMQVDFTWSKSAKKYIELYKSLV